MISRILSAAVLGVEAYLVRVETDVAPGLPSFSTVGMPQAAVREGKDRVVAAVRNSGYLVPPRRITVNLAPADIRKDGSAFDLPIALGILASTEQLPEEAAAGYLVLGELGLDGLLRPIRGALPIAITVRKRKLKGIILPIQNAREVALVDGVPVYPARSLQEVVHFLNGGPPLKAEPAEEPTSVSEEVHLDLADVRGQESAKRALEVAAAGAHNILMIGPPGSGKTMLARRIPSILPPLTLEESLETAKVRSVAGLINGRNPFDHLPPFRSPHHTVSDAGLIGGGSNPRPGEVSLAHNGVLFLDELAEFRRSALEVLRQPLEDNEVTIARAGLTLTYPARFMLVAAMNPCPCGFHGDEQRPCSCASQQVQRYLARVSGPLMDRIDLHVHVPAVAAEQMGSRRRGECSSALRDRISAARQLQRTRFAGREGVYANAHMKPRELREFCALDRRAAALLKSAMSRLALSARAYHRVLKIARTIADLSSAAEINSSHVAEAIQYRSMDRAPVPSADYARSIR